MEKLVWLVLGTLTGFVLAHLVDSTPQGHAAFGRLNACLAAFTDRAAAAYRDAQATAAR